MFKSYEEFRRFTNENGILIVDFKEMDMAGRWHHLTIPVERFTEELLETGIGFDGSSYGYLTVEKSDMLFIPDLSSAFVDPVAQTPTLCMIGDIYTVGAPPVRFAGDPRHIADKCEEYMLSTGVSDHCLVGPEFEFYILDNIEYRTDINHMEVHLNSAQAGWNSINSPYNRIQNNQGYKVGLHGGYHADMPWDITFGLRNRMIRTLEECGIPTKYHHCENGGPGQVEIEVNFATLREMCDRSQKLKYIVKNIAAIEGKTVTFMPKPFYGEAGSGEHVHLQMFKEGKPIFYDENGYAFMSKTALQAIGGILTHAAALTAFTNPSTNSFKRLVPGFEAPVSICFGAANRSAVIRIPAYATKPGDVRFEYRPGDAMANPYLAFSAIAMAAIDGILRCIDPTECGFGPFDKNMYQLDKDNTSVDELMKAVKALPKSLDEAAAALEADHDFLLKGNVFTEEIINGQIRRIKKDAVEVDQYPHPVEYKKYYDL